MDPPAITTNDSGATVLVLEGRIDRACIRALCAAVRVALAGHPGGLLICDVAGVVDPCAGTVDALARAQLTAVRAGGRVRLRGAGHALCELLELTGLDRVLPGEPGP